MSESIEALTEKSRDAILAELMDAGRSHTPFEYIARTEIIRLTARIAELENGFSMDSAPLDGTAILLQSETGSLNIGWRSGGVWSYGGGKWEDRLVVRWWPLPRTFREARTTLEASERGGGE